MDSAKKKKSRRVPSQIYQLTKELEILNDPIKLRESLIIREEKEKAIKALPKSREKKEKPKPLLPDPLLSNKEIDPPIPNTELSSRKIESMPESSKPLVERFAEDIPGFMATFLGEHITRAFSSFHVQIMEDLALLVRPGGGGMAHAVVERNGLALEKVFEQKKQVVEEKQKLTDSEDEEKGKILSALGAIDIKDNEIKEVKKEENDEKDRELKLPTNLRNWRDFKKYAVAAPRGHAKTTVVSLGFVLWAVCYRISRFILLISDTEDQAKLLLDAVKHELEGNERLRGVYGDLRGDHFWGELVIETSSGVRIQCRGTGQRVRGLKYRSERPGLVVCDDLEGDNEVLSQESRARTRRWFFSALLPCMSFDGRMVVVGTILHEDSLLKELIESWPSRMFAADKDGSSGCENPLWPEAFTTEDLLEIKREYTSKGMLDMFFREYFNRIVGNEDALFKKEYFKVAKKEVLKDLADQGQKLRCFLTVDPAYSGGSGHDWSVMVVTYVDADNNLYVGDIFRGRWAITGTMETLFNVVEAYDFDGIGMQKIDYERVFKVPILTEQRRRNKFFRVTPLVTYSALNRGLSSKQNRIARLAPRYSAGTIYHLEGCKGHGFLEEELLSHPYSRFDDVSDCLAMVLDLAFPATRKPVLTWKQFPVKTDIDNISGY